MKFIVLVLAVVLYGLFADSFADETEEFHCVDGVNYKENNCNGCFCHNGHLGCTAKACPSHEDPKYRDCKVGTTWKEGCNQCWCVGSMGTVCTVKC